MNKYQKYKQKYLTLKSHTQFGGNTYDDKFVFKENDDVKLLINNMKNETYVHDQNVIKMFDDMKEGETVVHDNVKITKLPYSDTNHSEYYMMNDTIIAICRRNHVHKNINDIMMSIKNEINHNTY